MGQRPPAPAIRFPKPLAPGDPTSLEFFGLLNFLLQFCPTHPSEVDLRARLEKIGVASGGAFDRAALAPDMRGALEAGMKDAWDEFERFKATEIDTGTSTAAGSTATTAMCFGSRRASCRRSTPSGRSRCTNCLRVCCTRTRSTVI